MRMNGRRIAFVLFSLLTLPTFANSFATYDVLNRTLAVYALNIGTGFYDARLRLDDSGRYQVLVLNPITRIPARIDSRFNPETGVIQLNYLYADLDGDGGYESAFASDLLLRADNTYQLQSLQPLSTASSNAIDDNDTPATNDPACFPGLRILQAWATHDTGQIRLVYDTGIHYYRSYDQWFMYDFYIQYKAQHMTTWGRAVYMRSGHADGVIWLDGDCDGCEGQEPSGGGLRVWVSNELLPMGDYGCVVRL